MRTKMIRRISALLAVVCILTAIPMSAGADTSSSMDGSYILVNGYTKYYAGIAGSSPSQSMAVKQQSYAGNTTQFWTITKIPGTDRYWIKNGGYCLGLSGTTVQMQTPYDSSSSWGFQQWYLDPVEMIDGRFGRFKIRSADSSQSGKVLGAVATSANSNVNLINYVSDTYYADEWYLCPRDEATVTLNVGYDASYSSRFGDAASRIQPYLVALQKKYITEFGIWISFTTPHIKTTYADQCNVGYNEFCHCVSNPECQNSGIGAHRLEEYHHTNINNIIFHNQLPSGNRLDMIFMGRHICEAGLHESRYIGGLVKSSQKTGVIVKWDSTSEERAVVVHEFGHYKTHFARPGETVLSYGLDHYANGRTAELQQLFPDDGYSDYCLYGVNQGNSNVIAGLTICGGCSKRILECRGQYIS